MLGCPHVVKLLATVARFFIQASHWGYLCGNKTWCMQGRFRANKLTAFFFILGHSVLSKCVGLDLKFCGNSTKILIILVFTNVLPQGKAALRQDIAEEGTHHGAVTYYFILLHVRGLNTCNLHKENDVYRNIQCYVMSFCFVLCKPVFTCRPYTDQAPLLILLSRTLFCLASKLYMKIPVRTNWNLLEYSSKQYNTWGPTCVMTNVIGLFGYNHCNGHRCSKIMWVYFKEINGLLIKHHSEFISDSLRMELCGGHDCWKKMWGI